MDLARTRARAVARLTAVASVARISDSSGISGPSNVREVVLMSNPPTDRAGEKGKAGTWAPLPEIEVAQRSSGDGLRGAARDRFVNGGIGLEPEQCALRSLPRADTCISESEYKDILGIDPQFGSRRLTDRASVAAPC